LFRNESDKVLIKDLIWEIILPARRKIPPAQPSSLPCSNDRKAALSKKVTFKSKSENDFSFLLHNKFIFYVKFNVDRYWF